MTDDVIDVPAVDADGATPTAAGMALAAQPRGGLVLPAATDSQIVEAFNRYVALTHTLLTDGDRQKIADKWFTKRSGWRKLMTAMSVSVTIDRYQHERDVNGSIVRSEFTVTATAPNGRSMDGYGACSIWDRCVKHYPNCKPGCTKHCGGREGGCDGFSHFSKPEHDVPATAETRAKNRAAADLFGMGEVSAEEVDRDDPATRLASWDEINPVIAAAVRLKEAGGNPGKYPTVLGVQLLEQFEEEGQKLKRILVTSAQASELLSALERAIESMRHDSDNAGGSAPDTDKAETAGTPEAAPPAAPDEGPAATAEGPDTSGAEPADGDDSGGTEPSRSDSTAGEDVGFPAPPDPAVEPKPSEKGQHSRLAIELKLIWPADGDAARAALVDVITQGRTRLARETLWDECQLAIRAAKLFRSGQLGFARVVRKGDKLVGELLPARDDGLPSIPAEGDIPTLVALQPEGGTMEAGEKFVGELRAYIEAHPPAIDDTAGTAE